MSAISLQTALLQNNLELLSSEQIQEIVLQYPYCSIGNVLQASHANTAHNVQVASLYKGNPVMFYYMLKKGEVKNTANSTQTVTNKTATILQEATADEPETDIVEQAANISKSSNYLEQKNVPLQDEEVQEFVSEAIAKKEINISVAEEQQLIITRSFNEWLLFFKQKKEKEIQETKSKEALTAMWQHQKLAEAAGEENEIVPEALFKQAIDSISPQYNFISESLASILVQQNKLDKAKDMYEKLSLKYPEKSAYFATLIKNLKT